MNINKELDIQHKTQYDDLHKQIHLDFVNVSSH